MNQTIKADLTEILFANRERKYGAYILRKRYPKVLFLATLIGVLLCSILPLAPLLAKVLGYETEVIADRGPKGPTWLDPNELPKPKLNTPPPPPPPKLPPPKVIQSLSFAIPEPAPEGEEEKTLHEQEELREAPVIGLEDIEGEEILPFEETSEEGLGLPEAVQETGEPDPNLILNPDEYPKVLNMKEVSQAIGYPDAAKRLAWKDKW